MHREFDPSETPFQARSSTGLYLFTALVGGLLLADVLPLFLDWLTSIGVSHGIPVWSRSAGTVRYSLVAAVLGTARHLYAAFGRIGEGKIGSDLAVAIAGLAAILIDEPLVAAEVVVIALAGECLEAVTFDRAQRALRTLGELFPLRTWVLRDGQEVRVFTTQLAVGDTVVVKPGGKIPVDGPVLHGQSTINTAALTGESLPREVGPGERVLAGSLNELGTLTIHAESVAKQTVAGRVIELTESALRDKAPLERTADRLAARFLPVVLGLALLAFFVHFLVQWNTPIDGQRIAAAQAMRIAVYPALAVLVVACPCPLVLATPAAVVAALGRLAGTGVLVKGGAALERLANVSAMAFDKTGTITEGQLEVGEVIPFGSTKEDVLSWAASAETSSEHPLARAIVSAAKTQGITPRPTHSFTAHPGGGIEALIDDATVLVGTKRFLTERTLAIDAEVESALTTLDSLGQTALLVAVGSRIIGAIGAKDTVRPEAAGVLADLRSLGLSPLVLLTGDRPAAAQAACAQLTFDTVHAGLLPHEKAERLPPHSAFIGDGINDAPAIARAQVGIAMAGAGADLAAEAGEIVLMGGTLRPLPLLVRLSRETARVIRQNIIWFGFGVNLFGVLLSGFLWPFFSPDAKWYVQAPLVGVLYHQLGSLLVLLNSMRLLGFERTSRHPSAMALRDRYRSLDRWLNTLHLDDILHEISHHRRALFRGVLVILVLGWLVSGLTRIEPGEVGVVSRFGAYVDDLGTGLHVRLPIGIERCTKVRVHDVRTVEVGFRTLSAAQRELLRIGKDEQEKLRRVESGWTSAHAEGIVRVTDESLMLTGDGNALEVLATVRYSVADPRLFLLGPADPVPTVRSSCEAVLRELAAAGRFVDLLTSERAAFEATARARLAERLGMLLPGIKLDGITVHDLHPPADVVTAYHAVAEAIQNRDRAINEATADATRSRRRAEENALALVHRAEADAKQRVREAQANADAFRAWQRERVTLSEGELKQLQLLRETRLKAGAEPKVVEKEIETTKAKWLAGRKWLTEFRLSLAAATSALAGRDKIIIDADQVPGKRTIYLFDPELFRGPLPARPAEPREP
ncbi:MAG: cation-translocating P-type ATPase family protein [Gemmataceae bacterium]